MIVRHNMTGCEHRDYECQDVELINGGFLIYTKSGSGYKRSIFVKMGDYDTLEYLSD